MELKGRSLARVTAGLLVAAQPEVQPASITTDSRWTIEAWRLSTLRHEWSLQSSGHPGLGEVVGGYFYYGDGVGMHRVAVPPGKPEERQTRLFPDGIRAWPLVKGGRVYFNGDGHSIYGLDASDLERGWRHYCDCLPEFADGDGAYGTGSVGFGLAPIRKDGEAFWKVGPGGGAGGTTTRQFARGGLFVSGEVMVAAGQDIRRPGTGYHVEVLSPYLYAFRKKTGRLLWRKPMVARHPVVTGARVVVWAGHRRTKGAYASPHHGAGPGLDWRLEIYHLATGRLLWRGLPRRDHAPPLAAIGSRFFVLENGVLTAYR